MRSPNFQRLPAIPGREDVVAKRTEGTGHKLAQHVLIFDHEDGEAFRRHAGDRVSWACRRFFDHGLLTQWEENTHLRPASALARRLDPAIVLLEHSVNCGQTHACALALFFRGVEGLEDSA